MTFGSLLLLAFWAVFTIRFGFKRIYNKCARENAYEEKLCRADEVRVKKAARVKKLLTAAKWALRIAGWIETILLALITAWFFYLIGAVISGTFILFGYPV